MDMTLQKVDYEVLNAASDDWESLEQIFISVRFEFISEKYDDSNKEFLCWRERNKDLTLCEIARALSRMVKSGRMEARLENGTPITSPPLSTTVECWYKTTDYGLSELNGIMLS